jgi:predicted dehydrogenase
LKYNVLIIGAGNIAALNDSADSKFVLSHAHAYNVHEGFNLIGFVDSNIKNAKEAALLWGGEAFNKIEEAFAQYRIDVVSVCVPDEYHYEVLSQLEDKPIKLILAEKPIVKTSKQANEIMNIYNKQSIRILVNYTRRFIPEIQKLHRNTNEGKYGDFITGTGYYGKGLLHNGSHMIDLILFLIGEISGFNKLSIEYDYFKDDPSVSAIFSMKSGGTFLLKHINCNKYTIFEMDLFFEKKRIRIFNLGISIEEYSIEENSVYSAYNTLNKACEYGTEHSSALYHTVKNIYENLEANEQLLCTLSDACKVLDICKTIAEG